MIGIIGGIIACLIGWFWEEFRNAKEGQGE
jgi:hypothetical protein